VIAPRLTDVCFHHPQAWLTDETHSAVRGLTPALGGENITAAATADADVATCLRDLKSLLGA